MASLSLTGLNAADIAFEYHQLAQEQARLQQIAQNWLYYSGVQQKQLTVREGQPDDNVTINLARLIVDKGASFLFGKELRWELQEGELIPEEELLDQIWRRNRQMSLLQRVAISGGVTGHVFIKILDPLPTEMPRLVNIPAEYVKVFYSPEDIEDVWRYRIQWSEKDREGRTVHRRQDILRPVDGDWQIKHRVAVGSDVWKEDPRYPDSTWPWAWSPMIDCQNMLNPGTYYGLSDLEDLGQQDAINYLASKIQRILRYHAHPKTWGSGFAPGDVKIAEDDTIILPSKEARLETLEMRSDLDGALGFMDRLINWFLAEARIPRLDPAQVNVGALSGFALKVLYGDLLEKTEVKRRTYGDMLVELNRRLLDMMGKGDDQLVTLHWSDPLPEDQKAEAERDKFELDYELVSKETVQSRRGLDPEVEKERIQGEEAESGNIGAELLRNFETQREE